MENMTRRDFLRLAGKDAAAGIAGMGLTGAFAEENGKKVYIPGTYTSKAKGMEDVTVSRNR